MTQQPGTLRPIPNPEAEVERLARARFQPLPAAIAHGDTIQVVTSGGKTLTGRVAIMGADVEPVDSRGHRSWTLIVEDGL